MQLKKVAKSTSNGKQSPIIAIVAIIVILGAGFMVYRTMAGDASPTVADQSTDTLTPPPMPVGSGTSGAVPLSTSAQSIPNPTPAASAHAQTAASAPHPIPKVPTQQVPCQPTKQSKNISMKIMKVFGSVTVSYPDGWKIGASHGNTAALFTDGTAAFEVLPPNPGANSAKVIAQTALKQLGGSVTGQGAGKANASDIYWIAAARGGEKMRIVGVDATTRIVLLMRAPNSKFARYMDVFNKMQQSISFGG